MKTKNALTAPQPSQSQKPGGGCLERLVGLAPSQCKTIADVLSLQTSHKFSGRWSLLVQHDGAAIIIEQHTGQPARATMTIPRDNFLRLAAWYHEIQPNKQAEP